MNRITFLIIGLIGLIFVVLVLVIMLSSGPGTEPTQNTPGGSLPNYTSTVEPPGSDTQTSVTKTRSLSTQSGASITVRDFLSDPAIKKDSNNPSFFYLGNYIDPADPTASSTPNYVIEFSGSSDFFTIALLKEPIADVRKEAEKYLMQQLGIAEEQMCDIKYVVSVPVRVNQIHAGTNLGLSFCPGATPL